MDFRGKSKLESAILNIAKKDQQIGMAVAQMLEVLTGEIVNLESRVAELETAVKKQAP
jgi:uncharacterized membrane protein YqgA involved in biofilm formation